MKFVTGTFPSTSGITRCRYYMYLPEKPRAALMVSHGMCEYIQRYRPFAEFLCENGIALVGNDHIGHGNSVTDSDMLGYFGEDGGFMYMVKDLHRMKIIMNKKLPGIPHFLLGHSMGSFIARIYLSRYDDCWDGAIIMGTAGGVTGSAPLRKLLEILCHSKDSRFRPEISKKLAFGLFNIRFHNRRTPNDWLSRWDENVDRFNADPLCSFTFTVAGFKDLLNALMCANSDCVIENPPTALPMLFVSGSMDPVGEYGKGVRSACMRYLEHGCMVNIHIYPEARHELLFELNRDEVMQDILRFINDNAGRIYHF
mgnify:FL=1